VVLFVKQFFSNTVLRGACSSQAFFAWLLTLWHLVGFEDFHGKTTRLHMALHGNFSGPVSATDLVKNSKDLASLVVYTRK